MGLFSSPKSQSTISDKQMKQLQERARKAEKDSIFSKRQVARRQADAKQRGKSIWS
jgi:hypothetical protein